MKDIIKKLQNELKEKNKKIAQLTKAKDIAEKKSTLTDVYLKSILVNLPNHIYWMDREGRIIGCNDLQAKHAGFKKSDDLIGKNIYDVAKKLGWKKNIADAIYKNDQRIMNTGKEEIIEENIILDGASRTFLAHKTPLRNEKGNIIGVLGTATDITGRKKTEKELQEAKEKAEAANKTKSIFIMNMSHDFRTPFSGISELAKYMLNKETDPQKQEELKHIIESSEKLLALLNEILELTKIESEKRTINLTVFNLKDTIKDITSILTTKAAHKGIELKIYYPNDIPRILINDQARVHRILLNLVSNAVKFTRKGYVAIKVDQKLIFKNKIKLKITVEDTGIGVSEDKHDFIFKRFNRISSRFQGLYDGTGLGLYITKKLIKDLKGTIKIESKPGKGSIFTCVIPFDIPSNLIKKEIKPPPQKKDKLTIKETSKLSLKKYKFLLIEDDKIARFMAKKLFTELNYSFDVANTAKKALKLLKNKYDFILMDIGLPDKDGITLSKEIRKKLKIKTPIIAVTSHAPEECKNQCLQAGINDVITKPLSKNKLQQIILNQH
jgi:two-component system, OmpR family, aerobic respiration control sensor histidine kinase ArcB